MNHRDESLFAPRRKVETPLVEQDTLPRITELLSDDPMPVNALGIQGESLFSLALSAGRLDVCGHLVGRRANPNRENSERKSPLAAHGQNMTAEQVLEAVDLGARVESTSRRKMKDADGNRRSPLSEVIFHMIDHGWDNRLQLLPLLWQRFPPPPSWAGIGRSSTRSSRPEATPMPAMRMAKTHSCTRSALALKRWQRSWLNKERAYGTATITERARSPKPLNTDGWSSRRRSTTSAYPSPRPILPDNPICCER